MSTKKFFTIKDAELVDFAMGTSDGRMSVILETRRPKIAIPVARPLVRADRQRSTSIRNSSDAEVLRTQAAYVAHTLEQLGLRQRARIAKIAGCFFVEVTRQELLVLAATPSIQAIRLNRTHRRLAPVGDRRYQPLAQ